MTVVVGDCYTVLTVVYMILVVFEEILEVVCGAAVVTVEVLLM